MSRRDARISPLLLLQQQQQQRHPSKNRMINEFKRRDLYILGSLLWFLPFISCITVKRDEFRSRYTPNSTWTKRNFQIWCLRRLDTGANFDPGVFNPMNTGLLLVLGVPTSAKTKMILYDSSRVFSRTCISARKRWEGVL